VFYIITKNNEYLIRDKDLTNSVTTNRDKATPFATKQGAKNYIKSCIQKKFRNNYLVQEIKEPKRTVSGEKIKKRNLQGLNPTKMILENEDLSPIFKDIDSFMDAFQIFSDTLKNLEYIKKFAEEKLDKMNDYQSTIDAALTDLDHFAEHSHCNASDGYKFWLMQHTLEEKRRYIKDFYVLFKQVTEKFNEYKYTDHKKNIENIREEKRNYTPRVLKELF